MNTIELWKTTGKISNEVFMLSQIQMAGSQQSRLIEKYKKQVRAAKINNTVQTIVVSIFLALLTFVPYRALAIYSTITLTPGNVQGALLALALSFGIYHAMQFLFIMTFKLMSIIALVDGSAFKFLKSLPISTADLSKLVILTFLRINMVEIIVMLVSLPVVSVIVTGSFTMLLVTLAGSATNIAFALFVQIKVSDVIARKILKTGASSRGQVILRVAFYVGYFMSLMVASFAFSFLLDFVDSLFAKAMAAGESLAIYNVILPFLLFPFSSAYLVSVTLMKGMLIPPTSLAIIIVAFLLLVILSVYLYRSSLASLSQMVGVDELAGDSRRAKVSIEEINVEISKPMTTLVKTNLLNMTRDFGNLTYFLITLIMPLFASVPLLFTSGGTLDIFTAFISPNTYTGILPFFSHMAISGAEESVGGLFSSLPIHGKQIYRSRFLVMILNILPGFAINTILISFAVNDLGSFLLMQAAVLSLIPGLVAVLLVMYAALFGKLNRRFTLFIVDARMKIGKYALIIAASFGLFLLEAVILLTSLILPTS
ncbi:hypothetical protein GF325_12010, partial [Candidatus Bathyarchaeota archaeon]|nr:hypothetical protein [Candidatus Bathyarchaeota archaeon]